MMCGIAGIWTTPQDPHSLKKIEIALTQMHRRGPDASAIETFQAGVGTACIGHARLSIIDLSSDGTQPMWTNDRLFAIVFNGEIYNYLELKQKLESLGHRFKTRTDTEVLLIAWREWGISCLPRLVGMFAFVVFDLIKNRTYCVRDAFGIKPLFYRYENGCFAFASEIFAVPHFSERPSLEADWQQAYDYLVHGSYDSTEITFLAATYRLRPANYLEINLDTGAMTAQKQWWTPDTRQTSTLSFNEAATEFRERFLRNVELHMRSDVPLGAALSGGLDSSSIVSAMRAVDNQREIKTFSFIASDPKISEETWVDTVVESCGATSHKVYADSTELARDLDDLIQTQGEPFGGTSIYAQYRVFKLAKEHGITVTLDGQGADEVLAGYIGYPGQRIRSILQDEGAFAAASFAWRWSKWPGRSLKKAASYFIGESSPDFLYGIARQAYGRSKTPPWLNKEFVENSRIKTYHPRSPREAGHSRFVIEALANSLQGRGLPSLLRHGDRNSMRFSVESRVPFLTIDLCDFLLGLPEDYLISREGETKRLMREALKGIVSDSVLTRKDKIGFATPEAKFLESTSIRKRLLEELSNHPTTSLIDKEYLLRQIEDTTFLQRHSNTAWRILNFCVWSRRLNEHQQMWQI